MKKKRKEQLLIDKKECSNCGHILEKDIKVCDECGYDMAMEEAFKIYNKEVKKFLNEQNVITYNANKKGQITKTEKNPVDIEKVIQQARPGSKIEINKVTDEGKKKNKKPNPWAICTSSIGRKNKKKYEKCIMDVKKQYDLDDDLQRLEEYIERIITDSEINPKIKKGNFKEFLSKLK